MALYNANLVDETVKSRLLLIMAEWVSTRVTTELGFIFYDIVDKRNPEEQTTSSPQLDTVADYYPDQRSVVGAFLQLLEREGNFLPVVQRLPNGIKRRSSKIDFNFTLLLPELVNLSYAARANTWAATSEQWLRICNADWVTGTAKASGHPMPTKEEIAGWMSSQRAYELDCW